MPAKKPAAKKPAAKKPPAKKPPAKRKPSAYNLFMKKEIADLKKKHSKLPHKEVFAMAAHNWTDSKKKK